MSLYLDHNATSPLRAEVASEMARVRGMQLGHPEARHRPGLAARQVVEQASQRIAASLGTEAQRLTWTASGTDSDRAGVQELLKRGPRVVAGATEHRAVLGCLQALAAQGRCQLVLAPVGPDGRHDLAALDRLLAAADGLALMAANSETGVISDLPAIARLVDRHGVAWHCDAVQAVGKLPVNLREGPWRAVSSVALASHKLGGPPGLGLLIGPARGHTGPPDPAALVGLATALELPSPHLQARRDALEAHLLQHFPRSRVHGAAAPRLPNTSYLSLRTPTGWIEGDVMVEELSLRGVHVSTGSACTSGDGRPSAALLAMGCGPEEAAAALRISLGPATPEHAADQLLAALIDTAGYG